MKAYSHRSNLTFESMCITPPSNKFTESSIQYHPSVGEQEVRTYRFLWCQQCIWSCLASWPPAQIRSTLRPCTCRLLPCYHPTRAIVLSVHSASISYPPGTEVMPQDNAGRRGIGDRKKIQRNTLLKSFHRNLSKFSEIIKRWQELQQFFHSLYKHRSEILRRINSFH